MKKYLITINLSLLFTFTGNSKSTDPMHIHRWTIFVDSHNQIWSLLETDNIDLAFSEAFVVFFLAPPKEQNLSRIYFDRKEKNMYVNFTGKAALNQRNKSRSKVYKIL